MSKPLIHLALAFDQGYIMPFYTLLVSIFSNNKLSKIHFHIIATGVADIEIESIQRFIQGEEGEVAFYDISSSGVDKFVVPDHEGSYLSVAAYYRLFFPVLLPNHILRIIYLDTDTLVVGALDELMEYDTQDFAIAAVTDTDMPVRYDLGIDNSEDYFNSGVLLIDIPKWKEQQITDRALQIIQEQPERIKQYADQDALNMVLHGKWYRLPVKYNLMRLYVPNEIPKRRFPDFLKEQTIIHYNGKKPWFSDCEHRLRHIYQQYARLSPVSGADKITKVALSKEKRNKLLRSRMIEFYFDHPEVVAVWRRLKSLVA